MLYWRSGVRLTINTGGFWLTARGRAGSNAREAVRLRSVKVES